MKNWPIASFSRADRSARLPLFSRITSTDAVLHASNRIFLTPLFAQTLLIGQTDPRG